MDYDCAERHQLIERLRRKYSNWKKLEVIGEADYSYFIAKHQYQKWKITYRITKSIIFILSFLINVLSVYLFWRTHFQLLMGYVC